MYHLLSASNVLGTSLLSLSAIKAHWSGFHIILILIFRMGGGVVQHVNFVC